jgi:EpsI family protein
MLLAVFALTAVWPPLQAHLAHDAKGGSVDIGRIDDRNGWVSVPGQLTDWRPDLSGARGELRQTFAKDGRQVGLHVAIYRDQTRDAKAITSTNQLVRTGNDLWKQVDADAVSMTIEGQRLDARTAVIAGPRQRLAVWQWFWVDGHETSSEYLAKLYQAFSVLQGHSDPVAWVVAYAPADGGTVNAGAVLREFRTDMHGSINAALRRAVAP